MPEPRNLLHIIDTGGPGGAETVLDTVVEGLDPTRWASAVILPGTGWLSQRLEARNTKIFFAPSRGRANLRYLSRLVEVIRSVQPAIIHAHLLSPGVYGSIASELADGPPLVCTLHGRPDIPDPDPLRPLKARILARARNAVAYVSNDLRHYAEPLLGIPPELGSVVHNGIRFARPNPTGSERRECGAGPGHLLVGAVGNVRDAKDYPTLIEAAAIVLAKRPEVRFVVAGEGGEISPGLHARVEELGLGDSFRFLGFRSDVSALMTAFDVFVSSSHTEGLPLATVEAAALGTPVVLTSVGGVPEIVESGVTGRLVPPRNPQALAEGILATLARPDLSREMARRGARFVKATFGAPAMCERYVQLYHRLIAAWCR